MVIESNKCHDDYCFIIHDIRLVHVTCKLVDCLVDYQLEVNLSSLFHWAPHGAKGVHKAAPADSVGCSLFCCISAEKKSIFR